MHTCARYNVMSHVLSLASMHIGTVIGRPIYIRTPMIAAVEIAAAVGLVQYPFAFPLASVVHVSAQQGSHVITVALAARRRRFGAGVEEGVGARDCVARIRGVVRRRGRARGRVEPAIAGLGSGAADRICQGATPKARGASDGIACGASHALQRPPVC